MAAIEGKTIDRCQRRWQGQGAGVIIFHLIIKRQFPNDSHRFSIDSIGYDDISSGSVVSGDGDGGSVVSIIEVSENGSG
ncbi:MAG: hypothetical protein BWY82_00337 [Verrucomicrobia bacterium ADurb.Bin474]|nr:MAG: hypothetical protein BWY82_00337 [Verrucomicrobia bacterium ADurb.Bin474]